jgi:cytochrome c553
MNTSTNAPGGGDEWQFPVGETDSREVTSKHTLGIDTLIWGSSDVRDWYDNGASLFYEDPIPGTDSTTLECGSCHDPHEYNQTYRMLKKQPGGAPISWRGSPIEVFVTDQLAYAEHAPDPSILNYTTDDYTEVDYTSPDVYDDDGVLVQVSYDSHGTPVVVDKYSQQLRNWCASCHTRYHAEKTSAAAPGSTDSTDAIYAFRHKTGDAMIDGVTSDSCGYNGAGCHGGPPEFNFNKNLGCVACHVAHGTAAEMDSRVQEQPWPGQDMEGSGVATDEHLDYGWDLDDDSRSNLLRLDNRGVCQNYYCHPKGTGEYLEGHIQGND